MPQIIASWAGTVTSWRPYHHPIASNIPSQKDVRRYIDEEVSNFSWARPEDIFSPTRIPRIVALRSRIFQAVFKMQGWNCLSKMSRFFGFDRSSIRHCLRKKPEWIRENLNAPMKYKERRWMIENKRIPPTKTKQEVAIESRKAREAAHRIKFDKMCLAIVKARSAGVSVADVMDRFSIPSIRAYQYRCRRGRSLTRGEVAQILYRQTG